VAKLLKTQFARFQPLQLAVAANLRMHSFGSAVHKALFLAGAGPDVRVELP